ncbi:MAG: hypothetical protein ACRDT5_21050 [Mycobacterium sp.]
MLIIVRRQRRHGDASPSPNPKNGGRAAQVTTGSADDLRHIWPWNKQSVGDIK